MPSIYVASLSDYNAGRRHGTWIHVNRDTDPDEIWDEIKRMLETSPTAGEEYAIHDHSGFEGVKIHEFESLEDVCFKARLVDLYGGKIVSAILDGGYCDLSEVEKWIEDHDRGEWSSIEDYAENLLEECGIFGGVPEILRTYFNYEAYARDLEFGREVFVIELDGGRVRVFSRH